MSSLFAVLVALPLFVGAILLLVARSTLRNAIVVAGAAAIAVLSVAAAVTFGNADSVFFGLPGDMAPGEALLAIEVALTVFVVAISVRYRRFLAPILAVAQLGITIFLEVSGRMPEADPARLFWFDRLSLVMVLVVGIIGPLICINAICSCSWPPCSAWSCPTTCR